MKTLRRFLQISLLNPPLPLAAADAPKHRIIDCHGHFCDPTRPEGVPWQGKGGSLYRQVLPDEWMAVDGPHGVTETVVMEASPWVEDNQWLLDVVAGDRLLCGITGNLDPESRDFAAQVRRFAAAPPQTQSDRQLGSFTP